MDKNRQFPSKEVGITDPKERLKLLSERASKVEIDPNIPPGRYKIYIIH